MTKTPDATGNSESFPSGQGLKRRAAQAGLWTILTTVIRLSVRIVSSIVLTRLLAPDAYGTMAIVFAVMVVLGMLSDLGIQAIIVQRKDEADAYFLRVAYCLQILRGLGIWLICGLFGGGIWLAGANGWIGSESAYAEPVLPLILIVTALSQVIAGFLSPYYQIAVRQLSGRPIFLIDSGASVFSTGFMICLGLLFPSVWVLAAGPLCNEVLRTVIAQLVSKQPIPRPAWDQAIFLEIIHKAKWIMASSAAHAISTQGDRLILGIFVSVETLGIYATGALIPMIFQTAFVRSLYQRVSFAALSEVNRDSSERISTIYYRMRTGFDLVIFTIAGGLFILGDEMILILYDPRYSDAGLVASMMAIALLTLPFEMVSKVYAARGQFNIEASLNFLHAISLVVGLPIALQIGSFETALYVIVLHRLPGVLMALFIGYRSGFINPFNEGRFLPVFLFGCALGLLGEWTLWSWAPQFLH